MARMKFLCDADRCIECNACVTACKNENEVPWGINRRRVVTINDGQPGELLAVFQLLRHRRRRNHGDRKERQSAEDVANFRDPRRHPNSSQFKYIVAASAAPHPVRPAL